MDEAPPHEVLSAQDFQEGKVLAAYAKYVVHQAVVKVGRPSLSGEMSVGSLCSGSEMASVAIDALGSALVDQAVPINFRTSFCCESVEGRRKWCQAVVDKLHPGSDTCVYNDITTLMGSASHCTRHGQACQVEEHFDGCIVGFSCKDASKANPNRGKLAASVLTTPTSAGGTNDTIHGALKVIDQRLPEWLLLENSDTLDDADHAAGLELLLNALASRGYDPMPFLIDASEYGLPQVRKRMYILSVLRPARRLTIANYTLYCEKVKELLVLFKVQGPDLLSVLLPDDSAVLGNELANRLSRGPPRGWDSSTIDNHRREWTKMGLRW